MSGDTGKTPTDRLVDGFVPSRMPPVRADGSLELSPAPTDPIAAPISICKLGPCAHYHELSSELDAQQPLDGTKIRLPLIVTRACYPSPGIELELEHAVFSCSRWMPTEPDRLHAIRQRYVTTNPDAYEEYLRSWGEEDVHDDGR